MKNFLYFGKELPKFKGEDFFHKIKWELPNVRRIQKGGKSSRIIRNVNFNLKIIQFSEFLDCYQIEAIIISLNTLVYNLVDSQLRC